MNIIKNSVNKINKFLDIQIIKITKIQILFAQKKMIKKIYGYLPNIIPLGKTKCFFRFSK